MPYKRLAYLFFLYPLYYSSLSHKNSWRVYKQHYCLHINNIKHLNVWEKRLGVVLLLF